MSGKVVTCDTPARIADHAVWRCECGSLWKGHWNYHTPQPYSRWPGAQKRIVKRHMKWLATRPDPLLLSKEDVEWLNRVS